MKNCYFVLFDTPIGDCGIAWRASGIVGVQLPEGDARATRGRMARRFPDAIEAAPSSPVRSAIDAIRALLRGEPSDLSGIELDMSNVPAFHQRVYELARRIPSGQTLTYGEIATRLGVRGAARAVGQALGRNPFAIVVPCHRVVAAGGRMGGFSAMGGVATKLRLLAIEGAKGARMLDLPM
jgi:methylated-DNA-[protein]-cysteine S-methyltransferase